MPNYTEELNNQQYSVITNGDGPCLVLAGAGSGKTRTITYRVAYLLEQGVQAENILLLTFTNKAANEMIERIKKLTGMGYKLPYAGTFHSVANKILRHYAWALDYQSNFTILDTDDSQSLIKMGVKEYKPNTDQKFPSARVIQSIISYGRNAEISIADVVDLKYPQWFEFIDPIRKIGDDYAKRKKESNAMDFDDLLVNFLLLLNKPDLQKKLSNQFKYILVDEYQDTNKIQASIIRKLSLAHNNVLVVGDDAQSIYSFRAADIANIIDFEKKYVGAKIFKLETNYRSSQQILDVANNVISNNVKQYEKELNTIDSKGVKPVLNPQTDQQQEARYIVKTIKNHLDKGIAKREVAVLFRAAMHSQMLEMELMKANIEYEYRGGLRFFDRAHIKDVLAYLRILNNLSDVPAWLRVLMHEEGVGPVAAQKIIGQIKLLSSRPESTSPTLSSRPESTSPTLSSRPEPEAEWRDPLKAISEIGYNVLGQKAKQGWHHFVRIWERLIEIDKNDITALVMSIKESPYSDYLEAEYVDAKERLEDIEQMAYFAEQYENLDDFLAEASLQEGFSRGILHKGQAKQTETGQKIILSTIHQAKGLEWDTVFVINLAGGAFPTEYAWKERDGIEEERRLFYVAITRAKKFLYLTYPLESKNWSVSGPSLFLEEIAIDLLDDRSILGNNIVLNDPTAGVEYVSEYSSHPVIKPGSFLIDVDDL